MSRGWQNNWWSRCARPLRKHSRLAWVGKHDFKASGCHSTLRLAHLLPPPRILCRGTLRRRQVDEPRRSIPTRNLEDMPGRNFSRAEVAAGATLPAKRSRYSRSAVRSVLRTGLASVLNRRTAFTFRRAGGRSATRSVRPSLRGSPQMPSQSLDGTRARHGATVGSRLGA